MLSAAFVTAGCVAQRPKQMPLAKTQTETLSILPAGFNKASLVGCWTWLQEDGDDDWLCFDKQGHYVIVVSYDRMGRDNVGIYDVTANGQLIFKDEDEILGASKLNIERGNPSEISLHGISNINAPILMKLRKDDKNDFYKEISKTYF